MRESELMKPFHEPAIHQTLRVIVRETLRMFGLKTVKRRSLFYGQRIGRDVIDRQSGDRLKRIVDIFDRL